MRAVSSNSLKGSDRWLAAILAVSVLVRLSATLYLGDAVEILPATHDQLSYDAVAISDADSRAEACFLRAMDAHPQAGRRLLRGQHLITNPEDSRLAASAAEQTPRDQSSRNLGLACRLMGDAMVSDAGRVQPGLGVSDIGLSTDSLELNLQARALCDMFPAAGPMARTGIGILAWRMTFVPG